MKENKIMLREDKELLLKDLCARLPYGVKIELTWWVMDEGTCINTILEPDHIEQLLKDEDDYTEIKPYLRPMSSMTEEEKKEYFNRTMTIDIVKTSKEVIDYCLSHHFDYRGLIEKGLAIAVTKENNPYENGL